MTLRLPDAQWRDAPQLARLLAALGGPEVTRAVGGAVRDTLAGLPVVDIDLATKLPPQEVVARLEAAGIKAVPTGIAHGTITAVADGHPYEVTTLRRDVATDGRRATVAFATDWVEDAARRDFTINALYADPLSGALFDPVGGIADLAARRVRFIGDAGQRIDEDHLRILRWFRFLARFGGGAPDAATLAVVSGRAAKLRALSRERVADELLRILALPDPAATIALMHDAGVLAHIVPEAGEGAAARVAALVQAESAAGLPADAVRRLIALLPPDAAVADSIAARLKLSRRIRKRIAAALSGGVEQDARAMAYRIGSEGAVDRLLLANAPERTAALAGWPVPRLPVSGGDLIALGVPQGPAVAQALHRLTDTWIAAGFPGRDDTLALAAAALRDG
jgi:poly(A) polymerase